ncbi:MAG TPA: hypothetical protein DIT89_04670 [Planctomycetaceae bacterium]|nr:hypothetical protein [Planctomycetaceae bacterium]
MRGEAKLPLVVFSPGMRNKANADLKTFRPAAEFRATGASKTTAKPDGNFDRNRAPCRPDASDTVVVRALSRARTARHTWIPGAFYGCGHAE